jgi:hypothetical protein
MMIHTEVRVSQAADRHRQLRTRASRRSQKAARPNPVSRWLRSVLSRGQLQPVTAADPKVTVHEPSLSVWMSSPQRRLGPIC